MKLNAAVIDPTQPRRITLDVLVPEVAEKEPLPTEFRLLACGYNDTTKGVFKLADDGAAAVQARIASRGVDTMVDYNHASLWSMFATDPAEAGKAAGWCKVEARADGLHATNIRWTPLAQEKLRAREYRYFSPTLDTDGEGNVLDLVNIALTNLPASKAQPPLMLSAAHNQRGTPPLLPEDPQMKQLLTALGLAPEATEAEALVRLQSVQNTNRDLLAATGKTTIPEALGTIAALKESAGRVEALSTELATYKAASRKAEIAALVEKGKAEGKIIASNEAFALSLGAADPAQLKSYIETMPKLVPTATHAEPIKTDTVSVELAQMAKALGVDPVVVLKHKLERTAAAEK